MADRPAVCTTRRHRVATFVNNRSFSHCSTDEWWERCTSRTVVKDPHSLEYKVYISPRKEQRLTVRDDPSLRHEPRATHNTEGGRSAVFPRGEGKKKRECGGKSNVLVTTLPCGLGRWVEGGGRGFVWRREGRWRKRRKKKSRKRKSRGGGGRGRGAEKRGR